jgi:hypothetical protein
MYQMSYCVVTPSGRIEVQAASIFRNEERRIAACTYDYDKKKMEATVGLVCANRERTGKIVQGRGENSCRQPLKHRC